MNEKLFYVEILRYGDPNESQFFGVFDLPLEEVIKKMRSYNDFRGGKYPKIRVSEVELNPEDLIYPESVIYTVD